MRRRRTRWRWRRLAIRVGWLRRKRRWRDSRPIGSATVYVADQHGWTEIGYGGRGEL